MTDDAAVDGVLGVVVEELAILDAAYRSLLYAGPYDILGDDVGVPCGCRIARKVAGGARTGGGSSGV